MRTIIVDQDEFEYSESEEQLEVAVATKGRRHHFPDVSSFCQSVREPSLAAPLPIPVEFEKLASAANIRAYLQRFAQVSLPQPCNWPTYVLSSDWDDVEVVIAGPAIHIHYHWWTTA